MQEKFRHFKELWRLHVASWAWEQLPGKGGPNGRSGHRMALHGHRIVLFGGFNDSGKSTTCGPGQEPRNQDSGFRPCIPTGKTPMLVCGAQVSPLPVNLISR